MKKWLLILLPLLLTFCSKSDLTSEVGFTETELSDILLIEAQGYDITGIEKFRDGYLVEDYLWIRPEQLDAYRNNPETRMTQHRNSQWINFDLQSRLGVRLTNNSGLEPEFYTFTACVNYARGVWTMAGAGYSNLNLDKSNPLAYINIYLETSEFFGDNNRLMIIVPCTSGQPGIGYINTSAQSFPGSPGEYLMMQKLFVHVVGHCLGFGHTGSTDLNDPEGGIQIPRTPETDSGSIMNKETNPLSWTGLSYYDSYATAYVYPLKPKYGPIVQSPAGEVVLGKKVQFSFSATNAFDPIFVWSVKRGNTNYPFTTLSNDKIEVKFDKPGTYVITVFMENWPRDEVQLQIDVKVYMKITTELDRIYEDNRNPYEERWKYGYSNNIAFYSDAAMTKKINTPSRIKVDLGLSVNHNDSSYITYSQRTIPAGTSTYYIGETIWEMQEVYSNVVYSHQESYFIRSWEALD